MQHPKKHKSIIVFYSYTLADKDVRDRLANHLVQLKRDGLISEWHDQMLLPGSDRALVIDQHIRSAQIILLLVSPNFLASDTCYYGEMQQALERHRRREAYVIPILVRPCDWEHSPFRHLQCLPRNGKPITNWDNWDEALVTIAQEIRHIVTQRQSFVPLPFNVQKQNRERLLKRVQAIWIKGLFEHSLYQAVWIDLQLQERPDVLENPWRLEVLELGYTFHPAPISASIVEVYDEADGELLILGEPGAGKTTLLLALTNVLLDRAAKDEQLRIPVVFNLSSWAEKRQPLPLWLRDELWMKYQIPRKIGENWIDSDRILPLLDGLDEVAEDARDACIQQINAYYLSLLERGESRMVVCCRSEEYAALATHAILRHAVNILPLTDEQINTYFEQVGKQAEGIRRALSEEDELHTLARQPLFLNIFTLAYQDSREVPGGETREEMQHAIFVRYVDRMLKRHKRSKRWMPEQVMRYLTFLAKKMQQCDQTVFSIERLQPEWLPSRKQKLLYQWSIGVVSGLVSGLVFGLACALLVGLISSSLIGLTFGLVCSLIVGLFIGFLVGRDTLIKPVETLTWSWKKACLGLIIGGLVGGGVGMMVGWISGVVVGLVGELAFGLLVGLSRRQILERLSLFPNEGIWRSAKNGLLVGPLVGVLVWSVGGLFTGLIAREFNGVSRGLFTGLLFGLVVWLIIWLVVGQFVGLGVGGLEAFVKHFTLRLFFLLQGNLPWGLVAFLDEAAEHLLLQKVGGNYIFVHRLLLEHFATLDGSVPVQKSALGISSKKGNDG